MAKAKKAASTNDEVVGMEPVEAVTETPPEDNSTGTEPKEDATPSETDFIENLISDEDYEDKPVSEETSEEKPEEKIVEEKPKEEIVAEVEPKPSVEETPPVVEPPVPVEAEPTVQPEVPKPEPQIQEVPPSQTPEEIKASYEKFFEDSIDALATKVYQLDEETIEKLDTQPSEVIPKLAGRLHMQILTAAVTQIANMLPGMMAMQGERQTVSQKNEQDFFESFPKLSEHRETVQRLATAYRQTNPDAPFKQAMEEVGAMSMVALRLIADTPQSPSPGPIPPVTPTSAKGPGAPPAPAVEKTQWDELIEEEE